MFKIFPVQAVRIGEDRRCLFKRDAALLAVTQGFPGVHENILLYIR